MQAEKWERVDVINGDLQAELLRGLLEAQGIAVYLSQEGAGHNVYPVSIGPLARVELLVHSSDVEAAREILKKYYAGEFDQGDTPTGESQENNSGSDQEA
jgi:hypothetical protein